jgi:GNAT superfamily N-acetyltransferase
VHDLLYNPVFESLSFKDKHLGSGTAMVKFFDKEVSPFAGFPTDNQNGFDELFELLPAERTILYATPSKMNKPKAWQLVHEIEGLQFVLKDPVKTGNAVTSPVPLSIEHVPQMVALAQLTKPGPFSTRTIEFGHYYGIFENDALIAMTGQRLHVHQYSEVSAVCTHPDHLGKGYAYTLMQHQVNLILDQGQIPFLHVRSDNQRAIEIYKRTGFEVSRNMNFYFLKKEAGSK